MNRHHLGKLLRFNAVAGAVLSALLPLKAAPSEIETGTPPPFRTESANGHLPWYQPKALEFPPRHSERRAAGILEAVDFIHRKGVFRFTETGELREFTMPPYCTARYLNAEADLRDIPIGTSLLFFLHQDPDGFFTRLASMQDLFTADAALGVTYRLDEIHREEGRLSVTKHSAADGSGALERTELTVCKSTRIWVGSKQGAVEDLKVGDELLFNGFNGSGHPRSECAEIWVGADTHAVASETQRKKFQDFLRARGLPGWIEKTEGRTVTMTFFGADAQDFKNAWAEDFIASKEIRLCVANDELRTWNPPVDGERGTISKVEWIPTDAHGCSGMRVEMVVTNMLEGFRRGRVARVFGPGWKVKDQFYGESLMGYGFGAMKNPELVENVAKEYPGQFPYRTDFGNRSLEWYRIKSGQRPPRFSEHVAKGELLSINPVERKGRFRIESSNTTVDFSILEFPAIAETVQKKKSSDPASSATTASPSARYRGANARLEDLPVGLLYRFNLYQDDSGAFSLCTLVRDEYSRHVDNATVLRIESVSGEEDRHIQLVAAEQLGLVKDYNGDMQQPPDIGRITLRVESQTRLWRGADRVGLEQLKAGETFLYNSTAEAPGTPAFCLDIWLLSEAVPKNSEKPSKAGR